MFLSRLFLNPRTRAVRNDAADPGEMHKTLMGCFPPSSTSMPRREFGVLYRLEDDPRAGRLMLLVQSVVHPDWGKLPPGYLLDLVDEFAGEPVDNPSTRSVAQEHAGIRADDRFVFRLRANTTRKVGTKTTADGTKSNGQRVPVGDEPAQVGWLSRHAKQAGFAVTEVRAAPLPAARSARGLTLAATQFDGRLTVVDADRFRVALAAGIGPAKAFGLGLLSLGVARSNS